MGIYLNPNNTVFKEFLSAPIYVDKTMMLAELNHFIDIGNKYVCVSRPRRFGKTLAGEMISAYYSKGSDSRALFSSLGIASDPSFEEKLNRYNVIKIDLNSEYQNTQDKGQLILRLSGKIKKELQKTFPDIAIHEDDTLAETILNVYSETGETYIILIDEYDVLVREKVSEQLFSEFLGFLNGLFKSATLRPAISLAYLTGILPIIRDKVQSKLNHFEEYTILDADCLAEYVGFTASDVKQLCDTYGMDFEECRLWYDGYRQYGYEIYNPESVVKSIQKKRYGSYWGKTSTYEAISERIRMNFDGTKDAVVRMLAGENAEVNVTRYMNTMDSFTNRDDVFTYLIHLGYLAYDMDDETCRIPNGEVRREWCNAIEEESGYETTTAIIEASRQLLNETLAGNTHAVETALDTSHIHVTSNRSYNNEDALQSAIYLAYIYALNKYTVIKEVTAGKGFADVVYIPIHPDRPALIIELKRNGTAESAITQIKNKQYFDCLTHYKGQLLFVGISYDEKTKSHSCTMEWFEA